MTDEEKTPAKTPARPRKPRPERHEVRAHNPDDYSGTANKLVATFATEASARRYIKTNHPRGREVFYSNPQSGVKEHYSADLDAQGEDPWTEYSEDEDYD